MIELWAIPVLLFFGALAGMLSGLLGVGGGLVFSPVIYFVLLAMGVPAEEAILIAFGTSLAAAFPTVLSSAIGHTRKKNVNWRVSIVMGCAGLITGFLGGFVATWLPVKVLTILFAIILVIGAIRQLTKLPSGNKETLSLPLAGGFGAIAGFFSGLLGVGGGIIMTPLMTIFGKLPMKKAIGTSAAAIVFVTIGGIISYLITGHVNWLIWIFLVVTAVPAALLSVKLSGKFSDIWLRRIFAILMIVVAIYISGILNLIPGWPGF